MRRHHSIAYKQSLLAINGLIVGTSGKLTLWIPLVESFNNEICMRILNVIEIDFTLRKTGIPVVVVLITVVL